MKQAKADLEYLYKIFSLPEPEESTLAKIDKDIRDNLHGFLDKQIAASSYSLDQLKSSFQEHAVPEDPSFVSDHAQHIMDQVVKHAVHTASPTFVGHMTSAVPYFMLPLARIMTALNQNQVKVETSKSFTPLEHQVLAMTHHLVYGRDQKFYSETMHRRDRSLGACCSGGTIANITALWVARHKFFLKHVGPKFRDQSLIQNIRTTGFDDLAILVSERGHYSVMKAASVLGLSAQNVIKVKTDSNYCIDIEDLKEKIGECKAKDLGVLAMVGVAGSTETGSVDDLKSMGEIAASEGIFFHADAAWGGATLFSEKNKTLLAGIENADAVTIDAHKQLYVPMGLGLVVFRDADDMNLIRHEADYIIRRDSFDIGKFTLEGSRPAMSLLLHAAYHIMGRKGFEILIDSGIEKAKRFAAMIQEHPDFELISDPLLNILTYRYAPSAVMSSQASMKEKNETLNRINISIQKRQREAGLSFVSRTTLPVERYGQQKIRVLRVVLANPLTTTEILSSILDEQVRYGQEILKQKL